jgi:glutathionylspermidine synthase
VEPRYLDETEPYRAFADRLLETCLVNDPWYDGVPIFRSAPVVVPAEIRDRLFDAARRLGALFEELAQVVHAEPALLDDFFHLPPHYKMMWLASDGLWHGFARFDSFFLEDGRLQICEINADTPSGQVEAVVPNQLLRDAHAELEDPNAAYADRLWDVLCAYHRRTFDAPPTRVGIIYPTDLPEDATLIELYRRWLTERGCHVVLGAPHNLGARPDGGANLLDEPIDLVLRHYKTDWWGERPRIFDDEDEVPNPEPLRRELRVILDAERNGKLTVVNPFGAIIPQDKLSLAFFWEKKERFSEEGQRTIEELVPETRRLDSFDREALRLEREDWVLKSDFGCEGDEVIVGANIDDAWWSAALDHCLPGIWVAQRFFRVAPITLDDEAGQGRYLPNWGIFLLGGEPGGLLVRVAPEGITTGEDARVVPVLVEPSPEKG